MLLSLHPDYMMTHTLWPRRADRTINVCEWHFHPRSWPATDSTRPTASTSGIITNRQDWHVCELSQAGISSPGYMPGPYLNREDLLYAFDQFIVEFHRNDYGRSGQGPRTRD